MRNPIKLEINVMSETSSSQAVKMTGATKKERLTDVHPGTQEALSGRKSLLPLWKTGLRKLANHLLQLLLEQFHCLCRCYGCRFTVFAVTIMDFRPHPPGRK